MALSWHMMVEFQPPLVACVVSAGNFSFAALRRTKACVIALPAVALTSKVVAVGKFARFGLTATPAERAPPPLIAERFANLECVVVDTRLVDRYNLFVLKVVKV
jgi:flavin reductase (DIM6/NTAB) family NADH-FMN oxidoreductase RutF